MQIMNNIDSINRKNDQSENYVKLKSTLSILTIGLFVFFGFASIDAAKPVLRSVDCQFYKPPVEKSQKITIAITDKETKQPITGQVIEVIISDYVKIEDNGECHLQLKSSYNKLLDFGLNGKASIDLSKIYLSRDDQIYVYFSFNRSNYYSEDHSFLVNVYDDVLVRSYSFLRLNQYP
jgi:hypothetical protein